jgi:hypothetical protein
MRDLHMPKKLCVIGTYFNPPRFKTRERLAREFMERMNANPLVNLFVVETAFGDREYHITEPDNPRHLQLATYDELWHKESTINLMAQRLPRDWQYVAWVDMDVQFVRDDWALETCHQLQHHHFVQLWQTASMMGPNMEITNNSTVKSFAYLYNIHQMKPTPAGYPYSGGGPTYAYPHPGLAWAARREAWDHVGGLLDTCILGAGDYHMAHALIGRAKETLEWNPQQKNGYHPNYRQMIMTWEKHAETFIKRDLGFVNGTILHHWHGRQEARKYNERWRTLVKHKFDPIGDLRKDSQGLYQLNPLKWGLRDAIRQYAKQRNEDSIDVF